MGDPEKAIEVHSDDHEDIEDDEDEENVSSKLMSDPKVMAALQGKLGSMVGSPSGYIQSLPAPVKRRIKALKKLQLESTNIEAQFYEEVHKLECKYQKLYTPIYDKRTTITKGDYEPKDEECEWPSDDEDEESNEEEKNKEKTDEGKGDNEAKGVPEFWLTIFKNVDLLQDMVQEHDEAPLAHLEDITVSFTSDPEPMGFTLHFHFSPNEYFENKVLTKEYLMKCKPSEDDPFSFEGPEIYKCKGCAVDWKKGKNLTVKTVKKKQKHKSKGSVRTITKTVKNDSFFNFFDPPEIPDDPEADLDGDMQELITTDFEIGHYIRERIIPRAVLFFTGEALDDDDYDDESDDEEGEEGEEEEDDPDYDPSKAKNPECKQQ